ncbi:hypothetical protein [Nitrosopumilus sp.]|uniref:hypothetical protein n=1 Tax=Nitrosopumilus sp. TaxID=2024843 RepID=UPI00247D10CA|nr:hypothetical protein [Nitrosopumilus sp.]MCV0431761.1 hypothetical protein [Nitrosopumilus sp.]
MSDDNQTKLSIGEIVLKGTIIAVIITIPSISGFVITWIISDNLIHAVVIGGIIHFITMGFSLKISKKILVKK